MPVVYTEKEGSPHGDKDRRVRLGLSLEELAGEAGVTPAELNGYESAKSDDSILGVASKVGPVLTKHEKKALKPDAGPGLL